MKLARALELGECTHNKDTKIRHMVINVAMQQCPEAQS